MMARWFGHPLLIISLVVMWLLLSRSISAGNIILGTGVALFAARVFSQLEVPKARIRFSKTIFTLAGIVLVDIIRSNIMVARIILGGKHTESISGFLYIPLELRNPYGLAVLALIVTATPGTIWVQYDSARRTLLLHVLDLVDEDEWTNLIKNRYERLLKEIFL